MKTFEIEITLDKNLFKEEITKEIIYYKDTYFDTVHFKGDLIRINGSRTKKINVGNALYTSLSTYYQAIIKSLLFSYFSVGDFQINKLEIRSETETMTVDPEVMMQKFTHKLVDKQMINTQILDIIFLNDGNAEVLMRALMYLTLSYNGNGSRFDNLWKSFNVLVKANTKEDKDFNMLKSFRTFMEENQGKFSDILAFANDEVDMDYLSKCGVNAMIKNNHPQLTPHKELAEINKLKTDLLLNYEDARLCRILKEKMVCKKNVLLRHNEYETIETELTNRISAGKVVNTDIVRFLILKYAYYLRCKYFHGEKWATEFLFANEESDELERVSIPLEILVLNMIKEKIWI